MVAPKDAPPTTARESVEEFLARGGRVEHLVAGARAQPVLRPMREWQKDDWLITQTGNPAPPAVSDDCGSLADSVRTPTLAGITRRRTCIAALRRD